MLSEVNPMSHSSRLEVLQIKRDQLKAGLAEIGDMRPGSLVGRFRKCGKPACHCVEKDAPGHGPCCSLTHAVEGKTVTRIIPKGAAVERSRQQMAGYHRFRDLVREQRAHECLLFFIPGNEHAIEQGQAALELCGIFSQPPNTGCTTVRRAKRPCFEAFRRAEALPTGLHLAAIGFSKLARLVCKRFSVSR
jgi:hypothetical protein